MPIYEYELEEGQDCSVCGGNFTLRRPLSAKPLTQCPLCKKAVKKTDLRIQHAEHHQTALYFRCQKSRVHGFEKNQQGRIRTSVNAISAHQKVVVLDDSTSALDAS